MPGGMSSSDGCPIDRPYMAEWNDFGDDIYADELARDMEGLQTTYTQYNPEDEDGDIGGYGGYGGGGFGGSNW